MNKKYNKKLSEIELSAGFDNELSSSEQLLSIQQVSEDESSLKQWQRYQLIGDVIRERGLSTSDDLLARISDHVEQEPALDVTPVLSDSATQAEIAAKAQVKRVLRQPPAVYALVASIFLAVVLVYNPFVKPVSQTTNSSPAITSQNTNQLRRISEIEYRELQAMMVAHGQFSTSPSLNGLAAYTKLVSQDNNAVY